MTVLELHIKSADGNKEVFVRTVDGWHHKVFPDFMQSSAIMQAIECKAEDVTTWPGYSE